ncbi:MAG: hypothetical protein WBF33_27125 [Candidatus Nitrosopolaris sp.]
MELYSSHFAFALSIHEDDLVDFIASEMQKEGLDLSNEKNLDSYLNTKFM